MTNDEGPGDILANSLKFGVSNATSVAIWGIALLVGFVLMFAVMIGGIFVFYDNIAATIAVMLLAYLPFVIVCIPLMGLMSQCMKTVIGGGRVMPTGLESPLALIKDGIATLIIALEAFALEMICFAPAFLLVFAAAFYENPVLSLLGMLLMLVAIPVLVVIVLLNAIQWAVYADSGSLIRGLNPLRAAGLVRSNPGGAVVMVAILFAASMVYGIVIFALEITIIGIILIPFLYVAMYGGMAYIIAAFYRQSASGIPAAFRDTPASGYQIT